jgi:hypothetical protein
MRRSFRPVPCLFLFAVMSFVGSQLRAQEKQISKIRASAIMVEMIQSGDIKLPAEFQVALYENLIQQLGKGAEVWRVYRDGDRNTAKSSDLVVLRSTVRGFKQGSEETRQVTTVAGSTTIIVHCQFTDAHGKVLLERDIQGKVRFLGGNLKATYDFAKKAAKVARENVSGAGGA